MAEEVVFMKGNEAIAHAAIRSVQTVTSDIPLLRNRRYWKLLPN